MMTEIPMGATPSWHADRDPDATALVVGDREVSRATFAAQSLAMARVLADRGIGQDDVVAIALPNGVEHLAATFATWRIGATPMPLSDRLPDAELQPILELAAPAVVIGVVADRAPGRMVLGSGFELDDPGGPPPAPLVAKYFRAITSGGSSGRPKVIVSHQAASVDPTEGVAGLGTGIVQLVPGPLFHTAGFSMATGGVMRGNTVVVMDRFDPEAFLAAIDRQRVQHVQVVPTMLHRVWRLPVEVRRRNDVSSLELVFSTGGAFAPWLKQAYSDWIGADKLLEIYGSSEGYGSTVVTGDEAAAKPGTVGRPRFGPPRILDDDAREVAAGEVGLIYFERPAEPTYHYLGAEPRVVDRWETLGDVGYVDDDGYLFLVDRRVDMIVTGGENVYPAEVEAAIEHHPEVRSAVVVGLPDADLGQRVHAIVDIGRDHGPSAPIDLDRLRAFLATRLVGYKLPRSLEVVDEPLRSDAGKVRRSQLSADRAARHKESTTTCD
jgi:bile acid-coenzyme A ligase